MDINVKVTGERLSKVLSIDDMIALQEKGMNDLKYLRELVGRFVIDNATGDYYPLVVVDTDDEFTITASDKAIARAGKVDLGGLMAFANAIKDGMENLLVPPSNAAS